jgi:hypothetical protein
MIMPEEPYKAKKIPDHWSDAEKRPVEGSIIAVSGLRLYDRGTVLMHPRSRSFPKYSIVEITLTDEQDANPGETINSVLYLGFFEVLTGGIVVVGESVNLNGTTIGAVAGFSDIHEPNHLNLIVKGNNKVSESWMKNSKDGNIVETGIHLHSTVVFGENRKNTIL